MEVVWIEIADSPDLWCDLGFSVVDDVAVVGGVEHRLIGASEDRRGVVRWGCSGIEDDVSSIDGIPTVAVASAPPAVKVEHPNGVYEIDHLVVFTPNTSRTATAFEALGLERRGDRDVNHAGDAVDMTFFWAGRTLLEVAGPAEPENGQKPAHIGGIAYSNRDLGATAGYLRERMTTPKDAVQAGRQIAALRREAGSTLPIAFMSPHVKPTGSVEN